MGRKKTGQDRIESQPATEYDQTPIVESSPHTSDLRRWVQEEKALGGDCCEDSVQPTGTGGPDILREPTVAPADLQSELNSRPNGATFEAATPVRRRGKCMSRRSGQKGHLEKSGRWWVVRWWMDVPGQEKRALKRARVCPISGPGSLSAAARQRRTSEIIAASGADTEAYFNKVVRQNSVTTFRQQSVIWIEQVKRRTRKPVAEQTLQNWEGPLRNWLNPNIGELPLSEVNNAALKALIPKLRLGGLGPESIKTYVNVAKMVVASAVNDEGEQLYPRKWNHDFIDLPIVRKERQNTPSFPSEIMSGLARWKYERERILFVLCGASGMRAGELLGLEIDKHFSPDFSSITVEQGVSNCKVQNHVKTASAYRQVDLHPEIAACIRGFVGERKTGFLFQTKNGKPLSLSTTLRRHLHPALRKLGYVNPHTGDHKAGMHAFRRFRNTYLRNSTACPEGLYKFWMGHAAKDMSDLYDKVKWDVALRKYWAKKVGYGFDLPSVVPNVPNKPQDNDLQNALQVPQSEPEPWIQ